jgi:hypothetical protein
MEKYFAASRDVPYGHLYDVQYGKIRVKYDTAYYTNMPYDISLVASQSWNVGTAIFKSQV